MLAGGVSWVLDFKAEWRRWHPGLLQQQCLARRNLPVQDIYGFSILTLETLFCWATQLQFFRMFAPVSGSGVGLGGNVGISQIAQSLFASSCLRGSARPSCLREDLGIAGKISTQSSPRCLPNLHRHCPSPSSIVIVIYDDDDGRGQPSWCHQDQKHYDHLYVITTRQVSQKDQIRD